MEKRKKRNRSLDEKINLGKLISEEYKKGIYTLSSICNAYGVPERTFRSWVNGEKKDLHPGFIADIADSFKKAKDRRETNKNLMLKDLAWEAALKRVQGSYVEEVYEIYENRVVNGKYEEILVGKKVVIKYIPPSDVMIIFVLKHLMPERFNTEYRIYLQELERKKANEQKSIYNDMTIEEIDEELEKYKKMRTDIDKGKMLDRK